MQNAEQLENAYNTLKDSAGSAEKEQEAYMDSLSGRINALKESFTAITMQMVNSDFLKDFISGLTTGVNAVSGFIDTFGAMPTTVTAVVGALTIFNSKFRESISTMVSFTPGLSEIQNKLKIFESNLVKQSERFKANISTIKEYNNSTTQMGPPIANAGQSLLGLNAKLVATQGMLLATKIATVALNVALSSVLSMGISLIISGLTTLADKMITTKSELKELNSEFASMTNVGDSDRLAYLIDQYSTINSTMKNMTEGTDEFTKAQSNLSSITEEICSIFPEASTSIDAETGSKKLNLAETEKLIEAEKSLYEAKANEVMSKNKISSVDDIKKIADEYQKAMEKVNEYNDMMSEGEKSVYKGGQKTSLSGNLTKAREEAEEYQEQIESLLPALKKLEESNPRLKGGYDLLYEAFYGTNEQLEDLEENAENASTSTEVLGDTLEDINGDGIIDATDQMLKLAETTDEAKTAVQNLGDAFSQLESPIKMLETAIEEFKEYGMVSDDTWSDIITSGNSELIALLGDNENFLKNAEQLYGNLKTQQEELAQQTIRRAQEDINASSQVVDATNAEISAVENLANAKENISSNSVQQRANMESILVANNANNYNTDESNYANKENNKIKGSFASATQRMNAEKDAVDNNAKNYGIDDKNFVSFANSKLGANDTLINGMINGTASMVSNNNSNYSRDAQNYVNYINTKINAYRAFAKAENQGLTLGTLGFKNELKELGKIQAEYEKTANAIGDISNAVNTYSGSGGVGGGVSHGSIGSGSSGSKGSSGSSSSSKEVENMEVEIDRYYDLNNAIEKVNDALEINDILSKNANDDAKLKYIKEEISLYNQKRQALEKLQAEQKKELSEFRNSLSSNGFTFGADGNISNLNSRLKSLESWANSASGTEKENRQTTVKNIESMIDSYEDLRDKVSDINADILDINNSIIDAQKDIADIIKDQYEEWKDLEEKKTDKLKEEIQKRKEMMQKEWETEDYQDELDEEQNKLNELMSQRQDAIRTGNENLISQLDKEIEEQRKTINDLIRDQERDDASDKYDEMMDTLDKELEAKLEAMDEKVTDDALLQAVQSGATSLEDIFSNIDLASRSVNKNILMVSDGITDWNTKLNDFVSTLNSISASAITLDLSGSLQGATTLTGSANPINISTVINLEGGTVISEATMNDIIAENNKYILKEVNNIFKR